MTGLFAPTIDQRVYQTMLSDIPLPLDGKVPHWAAVEGSYLLYAGMW